MVKDVERFFVEYCPKLNMAIKNFKMVNDVKLLCHLQQLEAEFMLMHIVPALREKGIKALPLHDAILCHEEHKDTVAEIIKRECQKVYGLEPTVKFKGCTQETLTATPPPESAPPDPIKAIEPPAFKFPVVGVKYEDIPRLFVHGLESKNSQEVESCFERIKEISLSYSIPSVFKDGVWFCCDNFRLQDFVTIVQKKVHRDFGFVPQLSFDDVWRRMAESPYQRTLL